MVFIHKCEVFCWCVVSLQTKTQLQLDIEKKPTVALKFVDVFINLIAIVSHT